MTATTTKNSFTAKRLWFLFLIVIPLNIFDILTSDIITSSFPFISTVGNFGVIICNLLYGLILLKLSSEYEFYKIAGICSILLTAINVWLNFVNGTPIGLDTSDGFTFGTFALSFIAIVFHIIILFYETNGHADILGPYDYELSSKWDKLRTWYIISYCGTGASIAFMFLLPLIGLLIMFASLIAIIVLSFMKYVYLYKTAKVFTKLSKGEDVSRETL